MRRFLALTRKEIGSILISPPILFATAFFVLLDSFAFYLNTVRQDVALAVFDDIALFMLFASILLFPLVSMHSFSADNATGTLETLLTAPISTFTAVLAKYTGAMVFVLIYLVHGLVYALLLSIGGNIDWRATMAAFLALFAFGSLAMSLGVFVSALTMSPVAAAAGSGGALLFITLAADLDPYSGGISYLFHSMSYLPHAKRWIAGQLDTRGLVYFVSATVLFLFYAWLAINSREPEKRNANATVRRRLTVTYLLVAAGFTLLLAQAAVLHINGFWESGMPLGPNLARIPRMWLLPLLFAAAAFVWSVFTYRAARRAQRSANQTPVQRYATISETQVMKAPRYYYEENLRARRRVAVAAVAALIVIVNVNWLSHYPFRTFAGTGMLGFLSRLQERNWDVTQDGRNSLSPTTKRILDTLQGRVQIYSFLPGGLKVNDVPVADETRRLLERYSDYNALVSNSFADAVREPELAARLAGELEFKPENLENLLVLDYQGRRMALPASSLAAAPDWRREMAGDSRWVYDGENRLTQAIMHLADPRVPTVVFTYGHLEMSLSATPFPERSVSGFVRALAGANMRVRQHSIAQAGPIPDDCEVLAVMAPRIPFRPEEVKEIRRYLDKGGRLLAFAPAGGPEFTVAEDPFNELLFELGGSFRDDVIEDRQHNDDNLALAVQGKSRGGGESAARMVFPLARSIRDNPRSAEDGWSCERMVETYPSAVAADMPGGSMKEGPFTLLYRSARETDNREARAAVFAAGRMVSDADIGRGQNEDLAVAMTQWLAGREESRDIEPREWVDRRLKLTGAQLRAVLWLSLVALPLAWMMAGVTVWWMRRD